MRCIDTQNIVQTIVLGFYINNKEVNEVHCNNVGYLSRTNSMKGLEYKLISLN
jgi:hypothetical protein